MINLDLLRIRPLVTCRYRMMLLVLPIYATQVPNVRNEKEDVLEQHC